MSIIGEGAYGTIYKPPVPCKGNSAKKYPNSIGKVFDEEKDMLEEKENHLIVEKIDPEHKYTLPLYRHCIAIKSDKPQLIYKYGGKSLYDILKTNGTIPKFKAVMKTLANLLHGIDALNNKKLCHRDIKPENILIKGNQVYLIDFGISSDYSKVFAKESKHVLEHNYPYYPPEFKLYFHKSSFRSFYYKYLKSLKLVSVIYNYKVSYVREFKNVLDINLKQELETSYNDPKFLPEKVDVYSLGIVFLLLIIWSGLLRKKYASHSENKLLKEKMIGLVKDMINFDPQKRISIKDVISRL